MGKVDITSQNHGYAIDKNSLVNTDLEVTHIALNDGTVEGLRHKTLHSLYNIILKQDQVQVTQIIYSMNL